MRCLESQTNDASCSRSAKKEHPASRAGCLVISKLANRAVYAMMSSLLQAVEVDRSQIKTFVLTSFSYATPGTWVSLRAFFEGRADLSPFKIVPVKLNGNLDDLVDRACRVAELAARAQEKIVFCPPVATFTGREHAREQDLAEGLVLSVECDVDPQTARAKLEELLGPPSLVVESGGKWTNPETSETEPKLHIYYCLKVPARSKDEQRKLKLARRLATKLVGGDPSNVSLVHPIRWPGSVHRKGDPKLCRIVGLDPDAVIDLDTALEVLQKAAGDDSTGIGISQGPDWSLPELTPAEREQIQKWFGHLPCKRLGAGLEANLDEVSAAVAAIPGEAIAAEPDWMRLARALAWEAKMWPERTEVLWEILDTASQRAPNYDRENNRRKFDRYIGEAGKHETPIDIEVVLHIAADHGWDGQWAVHHCTAFMRECHAKGMSYQEACAAIAADAIKAREWGGRLEKWQCKWLWEDDRASRRVADAGVKLKDFYAYMPMHNYIFAPAREPWPIASVNARIPPVTVGVNKIKASTWIDQNQPVEMMTWAPGMPMIIADRLIAEGGWIERKGVSCFNLYRSPMIELGDASKASPWVDLVRKVYPADADHIIKWFAARRQHPEIKINHGLFLGSREHGIGKDTILEGVRRAVGPWNFEDIAPKELFETYNPWKRAVILRVSEAKDMGDVSRFELYDAMKTLLAAPPDVLGCVDKFIKRHYVLNCVGVVITSNYLTDGIYLPAEDRRHYVAWSECKPADFDNCYWTWIWNWYDEGGDRHVAAYLATLDITGFDPKAAPPKTPAFWSIVNANRTGEEGELQDVLDKLGNPDAVTIKQIADEAPFSRGDYGLDDWLRDRKNRKAINHRLEKCGYRAVTNEVAKDGLWRIGGRRQVVYAKAELSLGKQQEAATALQRKTTEEEERKAAEEEKHEIDPTLADILEQKTRPE